MNFITTTQTNMITIKIKTWKDYKKDFIDWVQAPRRR